ncbi:citrate synthase/methylcitrate synthase [Epidermidibacterium keratini]
MTAPAGLKGVIVTETELGDVRGSEGFYHFRDYSAIELAKSCTFEQVWYLMLYGVLPAAGSPELADFTARIAQYRELPQRVLGLLRDAVTPHADPLYALRLALSALAIEDDVQPMYDTDEQTRLRQAERYAAIVPTVLAAAYRLGRGEGPIPADPRLSHTADYVRMATGQLPSAADERALETYLIGTIDHGFNASTFTSRVIASTGTDLISCLVGAMGSFLGPLHGGAPSRALAALDEIGDPANTAQWVRAQIAGGRKIMGFGHAVYRTHDPRSELLKSIVAKRDDPLVRQAIAVEDAVERTLAELKPGYPLYANVEFYAGVLMRLVGLDDAMFTPTFCVARVVGWSANALEEARRGKIIRPSAKYVGPPVRT